MLRFENDHLQTSEPESVDPAAPSSGGGIFFSNQPNSQSGSLQEKWMTMYLSACKLLDLILCLQPHQLNHFKLFRWSFVGEPGESTDDVYADVIDSKQTVEDGETTSVQREFVPHCVRIKRLLARKTTNGGRRLAQVKPLRPLLEIKRLTSLWELQEFFNTLVEPRTMLALHGRSGGVGYSSKGPEQRSFRHIETILQNDFVEPMT
uniref:Uncharacterized protein n=1 Tax=Ciona savignyi TaxID=51511 RepID=H2Z8M5_CIOSA